MFEAPDMTPEPPATYEDALQALTEQMRSSGHILEAARWGKFRGLRCDRCRTFHKDSEFGKWRKKCNPKPTSRQLVQHQEKKKAEVQKAAMDEHIKRAKLISAEMATEAKPRPNFLTTPTGEDDEDLKEFLEGKPFKRRKASVKEKGEATVEDKCARDEGSGEEPAAKKARTQDEQQQKVDAASGKPEQRQEEAESKEDEFGDSDKADANLFEILEAAVQENELCDPFFWSGGIVESSVAEAKVSSEEIQNDNPKTDKNEE